MTALRSSYALFLGYAALLWFGPGCGSEPVREDRSVNWSDKGERVAFQHGKEGVYVAGKDGKGLQKIYELGEDVIATSSPLWSPVDERLIFTAARRLDAKAGRLQNWATPPEGRLVWKSDVIYTCLLRAAPKEGEDSPPKPSELFQAACDHPGYIAANLAVRWHPDGQRILFIDKTSSGRHGLFEFDLATRKSEQIFSQNADALIFDWSPDGSHLVCLAAYEDKKERFASYTNGLWIRARDDLASWWKAPGSEKLLLGETSQPAKLRSMLQFNLNRGDTSSLLERLRATRPAWTADATRFAFVNHKPGKTKKEPDKTKRDPGLTWISLVDVRTRTTSKLYEAKAPLRDLHWRPDGKILGFVQGGQPSELRTVDTEGKVSPPLNQEPVRRFVGWNKLGDRLAYISPDHMPTHRQPNWALLLPPVHQARDRVFVADGQGNKAGKSVYSGMRITFPQWSPKEDKLSLWGTFSPTHRSWLSFILPMSLRSGDPAAILDCRSGQITWMAVNAHEKAQVGHYYLLKRDYQTAWSWYEQAAAGRRPPKPLSLTEAGKLAGIPGYNEVTFFEYYCLSKLGRQDDADKKLREFRRTMTLETSILAGLKEDDQDVKQKFNALVKFLIPFIQDIYVAEVYLSLDAPADGVQFFHQSLNRADTEVKRLSRAIAYSQMLLLTGRHEDYTKLAVETIAPLLMQFQKRYRAVSGDGGSIGKTPESIERGIVQSFGIAAVTPLFSPKFLNTISAKQVKRHVKSCQSLRAIAKQDVERLVIDLVLHTAFARLGRDAQHQAVAVRIRTIPGMEGFSGGEDGIDGVDDFISVLKRLAW